MALSGRSLLASVINPELIAALLLPTHRRPNFSADQSAPPQISKSETQISGPHLLKILDQWAWCGAWNLHSNNHLLHTPQMLLV